MNQQKTFQIAIGDGHLPEGWPENLRVVTHENNFPLKLLGIKGEIHIHLCGSWWEIISPQEIYAILMNLSVNQAQPVVTISI